MHKPLTFAAAVLALAAGTAFAAKDAAPEPKVAQQSRMKTCSADAKAKELKGAERKAFMSECLRKKA
jgi:hypothetical protein